MRPELPTIMNGLAATLREKVAPALEGDYAGGSVGMISIMIDMAAGSIDSAVDIRLREIASMRAIFAEAASHISDASLSSDLATAGTGQAPADYKISTLNEIHDDLSRLLIRLHTWLDEQTDETSGQMVQRILAYLLQSAAERMPAMPDFSEGVAEES